MMVFPIDALSRLAADVEDVTWRLARLHGVSRDRAELAVARMITEDFYYKPFAITSYDIEVAIVTTGKI